MDVGALLCRPRDPRCPECPLRRTCATRGVLPDETAVAPGAVRGQLPSTSWSRAAPAARRAGARGAISTPKRSASLVADGLAEVADGYAALP